ncbi:uncharacterized protein LOC144633847 [Oculina patagonica]
MSINFGRGDGGAYLCELSDSDHNLHPNDLRKQDGFTYRPAKNFCVNNPCSLNGRCQTGFTDTGYRCVCSARFTGEDCSIEKETETKPGISCQDVLQRGLSVGDGEYLIDPENDGSTLKVYCDMTTDGGGWLLVANIVINGRLPSLSSRPDDDYQGIQNYFNNLTRISNSAMKQLRAHLPFTQIRFHCSKQQGRTFHVTTAPNSTGEAVVQYFSGQTDIKPDACGSFVRMTDDNSRLASSCRLWGTDGKWGYDKFKGEARMYGNAAYIPRKYIWSINPYKDGRKECDDTSDTVSKGDFWKVFVR